MENRTPNGWVLRVHKSCQLGAGRQVLSTHSTYAQAEAKAKSLGYDLSLLEILDVYGGRVLTARV